MEFDFKKSLGQNFLRDSNIIRKIVDSAEIDKDTLVIEIGPGEGAISELIVSKAKYALLYEIDNRLKTYLDRKLSFFDNYKIIYNDFLKENIKDELNNYSYDKLFVVANLPYYITTPIVEKIIDDDILPDKMVLMMQKEVALRYSASVNTKSYGSLTVLLNYYYDIDKLFDVSSKSFIPEPKVDSSVICMKKKNNRLLVKDIGFFKKLVRDSFKFKRKTLKNNLRNYDLDVISKVLDKYDLDLNVRAESLSLDIFVDMANELI
ncbi:MAG: 16S rRNA (adenine(1518)-N(6)/adenine(1519)-N(6))-dimethyltransferase RsmA [Bacilli bacterium]|nr:16S rRNA (adenine(1518)-N(6)/adenine(1519)-N(6))-dimethyltransferase RsmA [Bacilli bacterium]